MQIIRLSIKNKTELLHFYQSLSENVTKFYRPFKIINEDIITKHLEETDRKEHISFGIEDNGKILGHGFILHINSETPVFGIGLDESIHGKGWGKKLMSILLQEADSIGIKKITLTVVKTNERAINLYKSNGFVIKGESRFEKENDSYYMERLKPET